MKRAAVVVIALAVIAGCAYLIIAGPTTSWPTAQCAVVGSRVVRADGPYGVQGATVVMYSGEYRLRYAVAGKEYALWAFAGWQDKSREFVQSKVESLPEPCPYTVRYNPKNPSEAVSNWR